MLHKNSLKLSLKTILFLFGFLLNAQSDFETSSPELEGFSKEKLEILNAEMHSFVDNKDISAIQTAIIRNGNSYTLIVMAIQIFLKKMPLKVTIFLELHL